MPEEDFHKQKTFPGFATTDEVVAQEKLPGKIGIYKIESFLEKGGMSLVYLGTHPETKDLITIKVLSPKFLSHPEAVRRFLNEAEIIAMTDHPNIVKLYGHGEWEGGLYIAMEFVEGVSLRQLLQHNPMSLRKALEIVLEIAYALCHLHTHGVIHRDLKPENILFTNSGLIKVIDFGIAQLLNDKQDLASSQKSRFIGTPFYMSPEQRSRPETVTYSSDIYSLGIIAYELILGKLSHGQIHISLIPKGLQKIIAKVLQPNVEDRYQDIVDFISDLSAYLNSDQLEKEKKGNDQFSEISEQLQQIHSVLIPRQPPHWEGIDIGFANYRGVLASGMYCDFLELSNKKYGILMAESANQGMSGVVFAAGLRGMVRSLFHLTGKPMELAFLLNDILIKDPSNQIFTLSYLILDATENRLSYLSCSYGNLWHIPVGMESPQKLSAQNIALGVDPQVKFEDISYRWEVGDTVLLHNFPLSSQMNQEKAIDEEIIRQGLIDNLHMPSQKQVEVLMRKMRTAAVKGIEERPLMMITLHRNQ